MSHSEQNRSIEKTVRKFSFARFSMPRRYTFGKPVTGKLTVNMTVNGVGYYRHEMGHPVIKTMEV